MKPIAKGRAAILGNITTQEPDGPHEWERAILVVFDSPEEFRKAAKYGAIDAPAFPSGSEKHNARP